MNDCASERTAVRVLATLTGLFSALMIALIVVVVILGCKYNKLKTEELIAATEPKAKSEIRKTNSSIQNADSVEEQVPTSRPVTYPIPIPRKIRQDEEVDNFIAKVTTV